MTPDRPDHLGQDIPAPIGTPVVSPFEGVVKRAGPSTGYGDAVVVYDPISGLYVELGHIQGPTISVDEGETVHAGQQVALSGNEGQSTGPHLHVGVDKGFFADRIDPNKAFNDHGSALC
jgi:murein DD-endopeptidase MepM/ murein hydrolase activator NlpD